MRKVKIFKSIENELETLEKDINDWLASSGGQLISVTGNISPQTQSGDGPLGSFTSSDVLVILMYEDGDG